MQNLDPNYERRPTDHINVIQIQYLHVSYWEGDRA